MNNDSQQFTLGPGKGSPAPQSSAFRNTTNNKFKLVSSLEEEAALSVHTHDILR